MNAERQPVNALAFGMMVVLCMLWGVQPITMKLAAPHISLGSRRKSGSIRY